MIVTIEFVTKTPIITATDNKKKTLNVKCSAFTELERREFKVITSKRETVEKTALLKAINTNLNNEFNKCVNEPVENFKITKIRRSTLIEKFQYHKKFGWCKSKSISEGH